MSVSYYLSIINKLISTLPKIAVLSIIVIVSLFFHFPSRFDTGNKQYIIQKQKSNHLFENAFTKHGRGSHAAKLETRILIPAMIRIFNLNKLSLIILSLLSGVLLLGACYFYLLEKAEAISAFWLTMAFAFTYTGASGFVETRFIFDALSLALVFIGFLSSRRIGGIWTWTFGILMYFFSILNDERSIFTILGFLVLTKLTERNCFKRVFISTFLSFLFYGIYRVLLRYYFLVDTPIDGVGMSLLIEQMNNIRMGVFMFGEGLWVLVLIWFYSLTKLKSWNTLYVLLYLFSLMLSFTVIDIGRSTIYWFPIFFIGLKTLLEFEPQKRSRYIYTIFLICFLVPTYYVSGKKSVWVSFSVFEQGTRMIINKY
jgi:hypothetical protein